MWYGDCGAGLARAIIKSMDERDFVTKKRAAWDQMAALIEKANGRQGVRALNREEILALGPLYRRVSSDLAYARAHATSQDLVLHLNGLVGKAHALLYEAAGTDSNPTRALIHFYSHEFPATLQKYTRFFVASIVISLAG